MSSKLKDKAGKNASVLVDQLKDWFSEFKKDILRLPNGTLHLTKGDNYLHIITSVFEEFPQRMSRWFAYGTWLVLLGLTIAFPKVGLTLWAFALIVMGLNDMRNKFKKSKTHKTPGKIATGRLKE